MEGTDQGLDGGDMERRLEDQPANRRGCRLGPEVVSGFNPSYSVSRVWCRLAQFCFLPLAFGVVETRRLELLTLSLQRRCSAN